MIIELLPTCPESFVRNCVIKSRHGDGIVLEQIDDHLVVARLDGYAVIPKEEFEELVKDRATLNSVVNRLKAAVAGAK